MKHLLSQSGMTASDLGMMLGNDRGLGSRLLNGQRELSKAHIRILVAKFHLSAELFL
jgi:antitoxin component HigA of HigAB toxin-antitoxin module